MLSGADLVVIVTDHDDFDYELVTRASRRVLDTRGRLAHVTADHVERL